MGGRVGLHVVSEALVRTRTGVRPACLRLPPCLRLPLPLTHPLDCPCVPTYTQIACLTGVVEAKVANALCQGKPANFDEWILRVMGKGIADLFMRPYNFKARRRTQQEQNALPRGRGAGRLPAGSVCSCLPNAAP